MNHITLHFNKMIAGFTSGENKHLVKPLYFSHQAEMSQVSGAKMSSADFAIQNVITYQITLAEQPQKIL